MVGAVEMPAEGSRRTTDGFESTLGHCYVVHEFEIHTVEVYTIGSNIVGKVAQMGFGTDLVGVGHACTSCSGNFDKHQ